MPAIRRSERPSSTLTQKDIKKRQAMLARKASVLRPAGTRVIRAVEGISGYCARCKVIQPLVNAIEAQLRNGKIVYIGECGECGDEAYKTRR